jgi:hypothetical protein
MPASQERQPTLDSIAPRSLVADMEQALLLFDESIPEKESSAE